MTSNVVWYVIIVQLNTKMNAVFIITLGMRETYKKYMDGGRIIDR